MKKKGFTLIELLAVIVILAIIALIATPLVLKYIEKSRSESKVDSAYSFVRNLETEVANFSIKHNGTKYNGKPNDKGYYDFDTFEKSEIDTTVKGDKPDNIKVCLSSLGQVEKGVFEYGNYYVSYDGKKSSIIGETTYTNFSCNDIIKEESGLYDPKGNLIATWDELVNDYNIDVTKKYSYYDEKSPGTILSSNEKLSKGVKLVIDSSVTEIGEFAFYMCTTIKEVIIPDSVISIGSCAFRYCTGINEIRLPINVTVINWSTFEGCTNLKEITIPSSVTKIVEEAFMDCTNLKVINYAGTEIVWNSINFEYNCNIGMSTDYVINYNYVMSQN